MLARRRKELWLGLQPLQQLNAKSRAEGVGGKGMLSYSQHQRSYDFSSLGGTGGAAGLRKLRRAILCIPVCTVELDL